MIEMVGEFELPLTSPFETAAGSIETRRGHVLEFATDEARGIGEATPLPGWTESESLCREVLERSLPAADPAVALESLQGLPAARHGVSTAALDQEATVAGEPLYQTLGSSETVTDVAVNTTIGDGSIEAAEASAHAALAEGFGTLKVKVGARDVEQDAARLRAIRSAVGSAVTLRADANGSWSQRQARRAIEAFPPLEYLEQPLPADDLAGHATLGEHATIALDESLRQRSVEQILAADAADVLVLKPMVLGGIDRAQSAAATARDAGVDPVVSTTIDGAIARTAAVHLAAAIQPTRACGLATAGLLETDIAADPTHVTDGAISVPQAPGIGVSLDR